MRETRVKRVVTEASSERNVERIETRRSMEIKAEASLAETLLTGSSVKIFDARFDAPPSFPPRIRLTAHPA